MFSISKRIIPSLFLALIIGKLTSFTNKSSDTASELGQSLDSLTNILNSFGVGYLKAVPIFNEYGKTGFENSFHLLNYLITYTIAFLIFFYLKDKFFGEKDFTFKEESNNYLDSSNFSNQSQYNEFSQNKSEKIKLHKINFQKPILIIKKIFTKIFNFIGFFLFKYYKLTSFFIIIIMFKITNFHDFESFDLFIQSLFFVSGIFVLNILNYFFCFYKK